MEAAFTVMAEFSPSLGCIAGLNDGEKKRGWRSLATGQSEGRGLWHVPCYFF